MAIDLMSEDILTLHQACQLFPAGREGTPAHISRLYRYTTTGCRGVVLESLQCGSTRCTTRQAVIRFIEQLTMTTGPVKHTSTEIDQGLASAAGQRLSQPPEYR